LALEEGISFAEALNPTRFDLDEFGAVRSIRMSTQHRSEAGQWRAGAEIEMAARTVLIAAGTQPNTVLAREDAEHFALDGRYFQACDEDGAPVRPEPAISKPKVAQVLLSKYADGRFISFFGDLHPSFFGNVVKAMGAAKQGYPSVSAVLQRISPASLLSDIEHQSGLARQRSSGHTPDAEYCRSHHQSANGGAQFPPRTILPPAKL